jgi:transcriptional regulator GlxA family with amidase domain
MRIHRPVWCELQRKGSIFRSTLVAREVEDALAAMFVQASLISLSSTQKLSSEETEPAHLGRAEDFLMAHLDSPVSLPEVADAAGVTVRTLSRASRSRRLETVRGELLAAEPGSTSVTQVALRYGFAHLGRFSVEYRKLFGERPSETLAR